MAKVKCSRCKELVDKFKFLDGDIPICKDCLEDLVFDAKFDQYEEERDRQKEEAQTCGEYRGLKANWWLTEAGEKKFDAMLKGLF